MRSAPVVALALGLVALLSIHCGGRVDAPADCPTNLTGACSTNAACTQHVTDCSGSYDVTCTCSNGAWSCPKQAGCPNPCANARQGASCGSEGLFCPQTDAPKCGAPQPSGGCTCTKGRFSCIQTACPVPPPVCPPPSTIEEGGVCSGNGTCGGELSCPQGGTVGVQYDCVNGRWQMWEYFADPCETIQPDDGGVIIVDAGSKG